RACAYTGHVQVKATCVNACPYPVQVTLVTFACSVFEDHAGEHEQCDQASERPDDRPRDPHDRIACQYQPQRPVMAITPQMPIAAATAGPGGISSAQPTIARPRDTAT